MSAADELLSKYEKTSKAATKLADIKDPQELMEAAAKVSEMAAELDASCKRFAASQIQPGGKEERVVLTPDQRQRIAEETGVALEMLVVTDKDGKFAHSMPMTDRATIERMAARQASEIALKKGKQAGVEKLIKALEKVGDPSLEPIIASIRADPTLATLTKQQKEAGEAAKKAAEEGPQPA